MMPKTIHLPARIGPYVVLEPIGGGASGAVAKCRHVDTGQIAAVKLAGPDPDHRARLRHEARVLLLLGRSRHPGVVDLLDTGTAQGVPWTAQRFIAGPDLTSARPTARHRFSTVDWDEVAQIGISIADALAHVHGQGIIHCDLSPRNILLENGKAPVLIDFDSAQVTYDDGTMREVVQSHGTLKGTPGYASPERILGTVGDARSDLYSFGCILYELATGVPPFHADTVEALCQQHLHRNPPAPSSKSSQIPKELEQLILSLLQKDPKGRVGRAEEVMATLTSASGERGPRLAAKHRQWNLHRPQLIGRENALRLLTANLEEAARGSGSFFLISGRSGIGKTRVLNEVAQQARDFMVCFGRCGTMTSGRAGERLSTRRGLEPFLPFLQWLAGYYKASVSPSSAKLLPVLAVLGQYEPSLAAVVPVSSVPKLPPELARSRVLQSLTEALELASVDRPILVLIDDLQWADDLTCAFLQHDYRSALESSRVLILAAHRSEEPEPALLGDNTRRIQLEPLKWDELGVMATDMLGTDLVPAGLAEALHRHSAGNPFVAAEYLRAFVECELLRRGANNDWEFSDTLSGRSGLSVPSSLRDLFALRLSALSAAAKEVLEVSSLLEREFSGELVTAIMRGTSGDRATADALEQLVALGILECSKQGDQYRFVHDKLRETQAQEIPDTRRRLLHRNIALLLEECRQEQRLEVALAELGVHWAETGEPAKAIPYLATAAEQAAARHMNADAADLYARALSQIELLLSEDRSWSAQAISLGEARGDVLGWSARHEEACAQQHATLALVNEGDTLRRARLERKKAKAYWTIHDYQNAIAALTRAKTLLGDLDRLSNDAEFSEWIEIQQGFFWLHYFARTGSPTDDLMRGMTDVVHRYGSPAQKSMFYECAVGDTLARDRYHYSEHAVTLARTSNSEISVSPEHLAQRADARFSLAFALLQGNLAECHEALGLLEENLRILTPIGEATLLTRSLAYLAIAWRRIGDVVQTQAAAASARRNAERVRLIPYIGVSLACEAWVLWKSGDMAGARRSSDEACVRWSKAQHAFPFQWLAKFILLDFHYLNDDFHAAARILSDMLDKHQQRLQDEVDASMLACLHCLEHEPDPRRASEALRNLLELARRHCYL